MQSIHESKIVYEENLAFFKIKTTNSPLNTQIFIKQQVLLNYFKKPSTNSDFHQCVYICATNLTYKMTDSIETSLSRTPLTTIFPTQWPA